MKKGIRLLVGLAVGMMLWTGVALGEDKPAGCQKAPAPENVEGQVVRIDPDKGMLTIRGTNGTTYEFRASKETLEEYKVGDSIKAKLRLAPECP